MGYLYLTIAILTEVIGTSALNVSNGMTKLIPSIVVVVTYAISFYCLAQVLRTIDMGLAYAIWSGVGIFLLAVVGYFMFDQRPDTAAIIGMSLIVIGVVVIFMFSKNTGH